MIGHLLPRRAVKSVKGEPLRRYVYVLRPGDKVRATTTLHGYAEWDGGERLWTYYEFVDPPKGSTEPQHPVASARAAHVEEAIRLAVGDADT